ncbi:MAG: bifunctional riboflavin kinase/FAD synthetase [Actinobacteria bacterium]|uniref:Bifunctional riboflavin kinase/FMN adenylyltransferase n=1 Tax=freshwater metagenome TaxID=449393 RepID=A0A6J7E8Z2_9ZZZZ|nr:bifunctional riboflavin kinase/FAD synthetase [Actinomycetota bacterium]
MKITTPATAEPRHRRVAIGEFDGVHLGHIEVIGDADTVLTFDPHPRAVVGPTGAPELLTTLEQKADLIAALGVDELVVATFDQDFSELTPDEFITKVLVDSLGATEVRVGQNFRFGNRAAGNAETLQADTRFSTTVAELVEHETGLISSSAIRDLIRVGNMDDARKLLGHPFEMRGVVVHGEKRGRTLGYPTANIVPAEGCVVPAFGVYAALLDGQPAAASVGIRPTFDDGEEVLLEVFILDFDGDLYGQEVSVELLSFLRPEAKFDRIEALKVQMAQDCQQSAVIAAAHVV